jgi:hypothetical protein
MPGDLYAKLGELTVAWSALDYVLRVALKRLEGLSMQAPKTPAEKKRIDVIFGRLTHGNLIDDLKKAVAATPVARLDPLIDAIGKCRAGKGLYARRNQIIHALWAKTPDGQEFQQRIGAKDWKTPLQITGPVIEQVIKDIRTTANQINRLTQKRARGRAFPRPRSRASSPP